MDYRSPVEPYKPTESSPFLAIGAPASAEEPGRQQMLWCLRPRVKSGCRESKFMFGSFEHFSRTSDLGLAFRFLVEGVRLLCRPRIHGRAVQGEDPRIPKHEALRLDFDPKQSYKRLCPKP